MLTCPVLYLIYVCGPVPKVSLFYLAPLTPHPILSRIPTPLSLVPGTELWQFPPSNMYHFKGKTQLHNLNGCYQP